MSSTQPPSEPPSNPEKQPEAPEQSSPNEQTQDAAMDTTPDQPAEDTFDDLSEDILSLGTDEILTRIRLLDNDIKVSFRSSQMFLCLHVHPGYAFRNNEITT